MVGWLIVQVKAAAWDYLAANWGFIVFYLIVAAIMCALVRKVIRVYGNGPMIGGVILLIIGAWTIGYRSAPTKMVVNTVEVPVVETVERVVTDTSGMDRLRNQLAAMTAQRDAALATVAQLRQELAAALAEIDRLRQALAAKPAVEELSGFEANAQCIACGHLMHVSEGMLKERLRCRNCGLIQSARSAVARRVYVLDHQR